MVKRYSLCGLFLSGSLCLTYWLAGELGAFADGEKPAVAAPGGVAMSGGLGELQRSLEVRLKSFEEKEAALAVRQREMDARAKVLEDQSVEMEHALAGLSAQIQAKDLEISKLQDTLAKVEKSAQTEQFSRLFEKMEAKQASRILDGMDSQLAGRILEGLPTAKAAEVLGKMSSESARKVTVRLAARRPGGTAGPVKTGKGGDEQH